ncbi:MAG: hypothetical protein M8354_09275 [Halalkalicoccus sp.]|nr:hypothetical protein [Halalkalicoccus sp.]
MSDNLPLRAVSTHAVFACDDCRNVLLGRRKFVRELQCCDEPLTELTDAAIDATTPTFETVVREVLGLPGSTDDICRYVIEAGAVTVTQVADELGYERSVITRYLNQLSDTGVLEKTTRIRERGGEINVYYALPVEEIERETIISLYLWASMAARAVDETNRTNAELVTNADVTTDKLATVFWA